MSFTPKSRTTLAVGVIVAVAVFAFGAMLWQQAEKSDAAHASGAAPGHAEAGSASVPAGSFRATQSQWKSLTIEPVAHAVFDAVASSDGVVAADDNHSASVFSQFSGRVTALYAQPGQEVTQGAPLLAVLATESAQAGSDLAAAVAAEATARKQAEVAAQTEKRQHELLLAQAGAEKDWLQSQADLAAATNALRAAQAGLQSARDKAAVLGAGLRPDASGVSTIVAPVAGVIVQRQVAPGQYINSLANGGSSPLFTLTDLHKVWALGYLSEDQAVRIQLGQPVEITAPALGDRTLRAKVSWISATVDPATHRLPVRADLANPDELLKPQMSIGFRILDSHPQPSLAIPRSALVYDGAEVRCYVVTGERQLSPRKLVIGRLAGNLAEVKSGLTASDQVVTRGGLFIDAAAQGDNP
jgi:cobalt-zinc-cadmium efflux system membrane fusion protein